MTHENTQIQTPTPTTDLHTFEAVTLYLEYVGPCSSGGCTLAAIQSSFAALETLILTHADTPAIQAAALDLSGRCFTAYTGRHPDEISYPEVLYAARRIHAAKDADYGDSFGRTVRKYGLIAALTRIADKVNRLASLDTKDPEVTGEAVSDTLLDTANYAAMLATLLDTWSPHYDALADTIPDMLSDSSYARLRAEAAQTHIRLARLKAAIHDATFPRTCREDLIYEQAGVMTRLASILDTRLDSWEPLGTDTDTTN